MIIAIDGMGGDNAPVEVVKGCVEALDAYHDIKIIITGKEENLKAELSKYQYDKERIEILNAEEVITNNEHPAMAIRRKKDSSLSKALYLVKDKKADAVVSAGSTGAFLTGATLIVGRIKGIDRPAFAPILPGKNGAFMVVDVGANVDCKPENLVQFAMMGSVYFNKILKVKEPKVGLVNIGLEEEKGNELTKETFKRLKETDLNFIGNVEPREIPVGDVNVLVCDGFVGNTILKLYEGVTSTLFSIIKDGIMKSFRTKVGGMLIKPIFKKFKKDFDYKEYGGAAFLGTKGICIKAHGSSDAKAFKNAIKQAKNNFDSDVTGTISHELEKILHKNKEIEEI
ncbi:phosphate:acyl-[acyl carrier protein] acyltransferase [Hathewaya proteolytica DSM 3090]|uniref:Phosphate acyltransferase n=1 Tax=Hathewaya proteolytica DSM 3090 TaxID=1121331 RepID=A0A1M6J8P8_9CLOT|nr:phosphate acyltransferase PlsX [Hathewaya proteolytica]SHJ43078.1 phosphate:acyl-[acyl carrier protein] acyltransferase [Hathewaya proteolytica DSM 3090]